MQIYSFQPLSGAIYLVPDINREFDIPKKWLSNEIRIFGTTAVYDGYGKKSPRDISEVTLKFSVYTLGTGIDGILDTLNTAFGNGVGKLTMLMSDLTFRWQYFKPYVVKEVPRIPFRKNIIDIEVTGTLYPFWVSTILNSDSASGASPLVRAITNAGNAETSQDLIFTITPTGSNLNAFTIAAGGYTLTWTNSLDPLTTSQSMVVDCGQGLIYRTSTPTFNERKYVSSNYSNLMRLLPGSNSITFSRSPGGNLSVVTNWRNTWI